MTEVHHCEQTFRREPTQNEVTRKHTECGIHNEQYSSKEATAEVFSGGKATELVACGIHHRLLSISILDFWGGPPC